MNATVDGALLRRIAGTAHPDVGQATDRLRFLLDGAGFEASDRVELLLGGSGASDPPLEGLTDADAVVVLEGESIAAPELQPSALPGVLAQQLRRAPGNPPSDGAIEIGAGRLSVTVSANGHDRLRLVPAVRRGHSVAMADARGEGWFGLSPVFFASVLQSENTRHGGRLVPVIRLAKLALSGQHAGADLNGYHVETLAIAVGRGYDGPPTVHSMLAHVLMGAADAVLRPLVNASGESLHIDDDLGPPNSAERSRIAETLADLGRRMAESKTATDWERLVRAAGR